MNEPNVYVVTNHEDDDDHLLAVCATPQAVRALMCELFAEDKGEDFWEKPLAAWDGNTSGVCIGDYIIRIRPVQQ